MLKTSPSYSDEQYDTLYRALTAAEARFPVLVTADSPSHRVGGSPLERFEKYRHSSPLLSLANAFETESLRDWYGRIEKLLGDQALSSPPALTLEPKIDGIALSLTYVDGVLKTAATRGNGIEGENVTAQARTIPEIPLSLDKLFLTDIPPVIEVRGETYMRIADFDAMNQRLAAPGRQAVCQPPQQYCRKRSPA